MRRTGAGEFLRFLFVPGFAPFPALIFRSFRMS
jgi:hypothetical protein